MPAANEAEADVRILRASRKRKWLMALGLVLIGAGGAVARVLTLPPNDLLTLPPVVGQRVAMVPVQHNAEPPLRATPRAVCEPGSHPLGGVQGRVPAAALHAPAAAHGYTCNVTEISHQGQTGGFKVLRYVDKHGHVCAFSDTTLLFPTNAFNLSSSSLGVAVLDMANPAHPVQTDTLKSLPMLSPHESLSLNTRRGLLAAVLGNPATAPGLVSIYDASQDCRHPVLDSTALVAPFGHEGNFSADGRTFWAAGTAVKSLTAIDVTNPKRPRAIWQGSVVLARSHAQRQRRPGLRGGSDRRPAADPRHEPDPGPQASPSGPRDQPADLEELDNPSERDPDDDQRAALRARVRRVRLSLQLAGAAGHGGRGAHH